MLPSKYYAIITNELLNYIPKTIVQYIILDYLKIINENTLNCRLCQSCNEFLCFKQ